MHCLRNIYFRSAFLLAALPGLALAQEEPLAEDVGPKILAGLGVQAVDNLFAASSNGVSDVIVTSTLGLSLKAAHSRQRLALDAAFTDNQYLAHSDWNFIGANLSGGWQWTSGTGFHGGASASHVVSQNPAVANASSTQRNLNTTDSNQLSLGYELDGGWDLNSGLVYISSKNEGAVVGQTGFQYNGVYLGTTYTFRSGNTMTLTVQDAKGNNIYDFAIHSSELKFSTGAQPEEITFTWELLHWNQTYALRPEFNFSVIGGGVQANWPITAKTTLGAAVLRQFYANPGPTSIYSVTDSITLTPAWQMSPKLILRGVIRSGVTRDQGDPGGGASGRVDRVQTQSLGLYWALRDNALVSLSVGRTERTSTAANSDFIANNVTLQATLTF